MKKIITFFLILMVFASTAMADAKPIRISIGTQDTTINCSTGGLLIRQLGLLEKYLPKDKLYSVEWKNFTSGPPLTTEMLANKIDIGVMGEFPAIRNIMVFKKANKKSVFVSVISGSEFGSGNGIVVPINSTVETIKDLKGKTVSVPFGSAAHAMLLRALKNSGLTTRDVMIINQSPELAGSSLKSNKIDAHAGFVPFAELFVETGIAKKIYDGKDSKNATFHGVIVNDVFAKRNPEVIVAYLMASMEANELISKNPEKYSKIISDVSKIDQKVIQQYFTQGQKNQIQHRSFEFNSSYRKAIIQAADTLSLLGYSEESIDLNEIIDESYLVEAKKRFKQK